MHVHDALDVNEPIAIDYSLQVTAIITGVVLVYSFFFCSRPLRNGQGRWRTVGGRASMCAVYF